MALEKMADAKTAPAIYTYVMRLHEEGKADVAVMLARNAYHNDQAGISATKAFIQFSSSETGKLVFAARSI